MNQRRTSPRGVTFYILIAYIVLPSATGAVVGDLNLDGVVDFDDFFILADNFGKVGGPTSSDTVFVAVTIRDTVYVERVVRDTIPVIETIRDTVYLPSVSGFAEITKVIVDSSYIRVENQNYIAIPDDRVTLSTTVLIQVSSEGRSKFLCPV